MTLIFLGTVILIVLCQIFWVGGVQPGGVVLCIILFNTPADSYITYALSRMFDTGIGVLAALMVNSLFQEDLPWTAERFCRNLRQKAAGSEELSEDAGALVVNQKS